MADAAVEGGFEQKDTCVFCRIVAKLRDTTPGRVVVGGDDDGASEPDFSKPGRRRVGWPSMLDGMVMVEIRPLRTDHSGRKAVDAVNALAQAEGWPTFAEPALLRRLIDAPARHPQSHRNRVDAPRSRRCRLRPRIDQRAPCLPLGHSRRHPLARARSWATAHHVSLPHQRCRAAGSTVGTRKCGLLRPPAKSPDDGLSPLPTSAKHWN